MPNIKPISDLINYNDVLQGISVEEPVFLTKNGKGKYAIIAIEEYERMTAQLKLMSEISKGEQSANENGWLSLETVKEELGLNG